MVWDGRWQERAERGLSMRLQTPPKVEKLRKALHAKAKAEPEFRFYVLYDKVYRDDIVAHAYALCRANGGAPGVDGETFEAIELRGREAWLGELTQQLRDKCYRAAPVRRVWLDKANGGQRPLGIPTIRDRVVQTAAVLVLEPVSRPTCSRSSTHTELVTARMTQYARCTGWRGAVIVRLSRRT